MRKCPKNSMREDLLNKTESEEEIRTIKIQEMTGSSTLNMTMKENKDENNTAQERKNGIMMIKNKEIIEEKTSMIGEILEVEAGKMEGMTKTNSSKTSEGTTKNATKEKRVDLMLITVIIMITTPTIVIGHSMQKRKSKKYWKIKCLSKKTLTID
jgi:hypothetical protein